MAEIIVAAIKIAVFAVIMGLAWRAFKKAAGE